jgi:hypothetical protein
MLQRLLLNFAVSPSGFPVASSDELDRELIVNTFLYINQFILAANIKLLTIVSSLFHLISTSS